MRLENGTTGVLIIHNDSSLLTQTLESVSGLVDRLVVVDGAYEWVAPFCELNGEDSHSSTDGLIGILNKSGIPYSYHTGVWKNETAKRQASLELVETDRVMLIDSDEIYDVDEGKLNEFWRSGKAMAPLLAPLFLHDNVVTWHKESKTYPSKPVFLNLASQDLKTIVASLWLLLPESEKGSVLARKQIESSPLGMLYHLSMFRTEGNPYRRSRFYNLLSMRVAGRIGLGVNREFQSDAEFTGLLKTANRAALDAMFACHRLAAAYPQKKDNQELVQFSFENGDFKEVVVEAYKKMLSDQSNRTTSLLGKNIEMFSGRSIFADFTGVVSSRPSTLRVEHPKGSHCKLLWHVDVGTQRVEIRSESGEFPDLSNYVGFRRLLAEVTVSEPRTETLSLSIELGH